MQIEKLFEEYDYVPKKTFECPICKEMKSESELLKLHCPQEHKYCYKCLRNEIENQIHNKCKPRCIDCNKNEYGEIEYYYLSYEELCAIYSRGCYYSNNEEDVKIFKELDTKFYDDLMHVLYVTCAHCGKKFVSPFNDESELDKDLQNIKKVSVFTDDLNQQSLVQYQCKYCNKATCSNCDKMYHYDTSCREYKELCQEWEEWKRFGRSHYAYLLMDNKQRKEHFAEEKKKFEREKQLAEQNYQQALKDEEYLATKAKYCPHCHRVVEHMGGCDLMVCGRNWHGGNSQNGCGKDFRWSQALPYQKAEIKKKVVEFNEAPVEDIIKCTHDKIFSCAICGKRPIIGYRFKCLNCCCCYLCEECDRNRSNEHEGGKHVFEVIREDGTKQ